MKNIEQVNHPKHYNNHPSGIEAIVLVEHMDFCLGSAFKYLFRCTEKGNTLEDLKKALFYLERERSLRSDSFWLRCWFADYSVLLDGPRVIQTVLDNDTRFSGHMAAALGHIWAAHDCRGIHLPLDNAICSVEKMIRITEYRKNSEVKFSQTRI